MNESRRAVGMLNSVDNELRERQWKRRKRMKSAK